MEKSWTKICSVILVLVYGISVVPAQEFRNSFEKNNYGYERENGEKILKDDLPISIEENHNGTEIVEWEIGENYIADLNGNEFVIENILGMEFRNEIEKFKLIEFENEEVAKKEWEKICLKILDDFFEKYKIDDKEFVSLTGKKIEQELFNEILFNVLYDNSSIKNYVDMNAPEIIAEKLMDEINDGFNGNMSYWENHNDDNMVDFVAKNSGDKNENILIYERQFEEGMKKWEQVELEFLTAKSEWEEKLKNDFNSVRDKWQNAWENIEANKIEWLKNFEKEFESRKTQWEEGREILVKNLELELEKYSNDLEALNNEKLEVVEKLIADYELRRNSLYEASQMIKIWFKDNAQKFDCLYSYAGQSNGLDVPDEINSKVCEGIIREIENLNQILSGVDENSLDRENFLVQRIIYDKDVLRFNLENLKSWCDFVIEKDSQNMAVIEQLKTICADNSIYEKLNEFELENLENEKQAWVYEYEKWKAVYEYSVNNLNSIESSDSSYKKLEELNNEYNKVLNDYEKLNVKIQEEEKVVKNLKLQIDEAEREYQECLLKYKAATDSYNEINFSDINSKVKIEEGRLGIFERQIKESFNNYIEDFDFKILAYINSLYAFEYDTYKKIENEAKRKKEIADKYGADSTGYDDSMNFTYSDYNEKVKNELNGICVYVQQVLNDINNGKEFDSGKENNDHSREMISFGSMNLYELFDSVIENAVELKGKVEAVNGKISSVNESYDGKLIFDSSIDVNYFEPVDIVVKKIQDLAENFDIRNYQDLNGNMSDEELMVKVNERLAVIGSCSDGNRLIEKYENCIDELSNCSFEYLDFCKKLELAKSELEKTKSEYTAVCDNLEGKTGNDLYEKYSQSLVQYNADVDAKKELYNKVAFCKNEVNKQNAVIEWAGNEFLHMQKESSDYKDPLEKMQYALEKTSQIEQEIDRLKKSYENINSENYKCFVADYELKCNEYVTAQNVYEKYSFAVQKSAERIEELSQIERQNFARMVCSYDIDSIVKEVTEDNFLSEKVKLVEIKDEGGNIHFDFELAENIEKDESDYLLFRKYFGSEAKSGYENGVTFAMEDAVKWLDSFKDKPYSLETVMLASSLYAENELKEYLTGDLPDMVKAINVKEAYDEGLDKSAKEALKVLTDFGQLNEIARFIMYDRFVFNPELNTDKILRYSMGVAGNESVIFQLEQRLEVLFDLTVMDGIMCASMAALCWTPVGWAGLAAATASLIVHQTESAEVKEFLGDINNVLSGIKSLKDSSLYDMNGILGRWNDARLALKNEQDWMSQLFYGNKIGEGDYIKDADLRDVLARVLCSGLEGNEKSKLYEDYSGLISESINGSEKTIPELLAKISERLDNEKNLQYEKIELLAAERSVSNEWSNLLYEKEKSSAIYRSFLTDGYDNYLNFNDVITGEGIAGLYESYSSQLNLDTVNRIEAKLRESNFSLSDYDKQYEEFIVQMENTRKTAEREWTLAQEKINSQFENWKADWEKEFSRDKALVEDEYKNIVLKKTQWMNEQYENIAADMFEEFNENSSTKTFNELAKEINDNVLNQYGIDFDVKLDIKTDLIPDNKFVPMMMFDSVTHDFNDDDIRTGVMEDLRKLDQAAMDIALKQSQEFLQEKIQSGIENLLDDIHSSNMKMEQWETELVRSNGYNVDSKIWRNAVIDSLVSGTIRKVQTVHKYEWFNPVDVNFRDYLNMQNTQDSQLILDLLKQSYLDINKYRIQYLGDENTEGEFSRHVGVPGKLIDSPDPDKTREENILENGSGQLGKIMLDFNWNSIENRYGYSQLNIPLYEKKFLQNNQIFGIELPTVKDVVSIICDMVGTFIPPVAYVDDVLFTYLSATSGSQDNSHVAQELLSKTASVVLGQAGKVVGEQIGNLATSEFNKIILQGLAKGTENYVSSVSDYALGYLGSDKEFSWEDFASYLGSGAAIGSAVGGLVTGSAKQYFAGTNGEKIFGFNSSQQNSVEGFSNFLGNGTKAFTELAVDGKTTVNLLNVNGIGLLELGLGTNGVSAKIGSGGNGLFIDKFIAGATVLDKAYEINSFASSYDESVYKELVTALQAQYGYGNDTVKKQLNQILDGSTSLVFADESSGDLTHGGIARTFEIDGQRVVAVKDCNGNLAVVLAHEAYRNGLNDGKEGQLAETVNAVSGHTEFIENMLDDGRALDGLVTDGALRDYLRMKIIQEAGFEKEYINTFYGTNEDWWMVLSDGSLYDDGKDGVISYEDGYETWETHNKGKLGSLAEYFGISTAVAEKLFLGPAGYKYSAGKGWNKSGLVIDRATIKKYFEEQKIRFCEIENDMTLFSGELNEQKERERINYWCKRRGGADIEKLTKLAKEKELGYDKNVILQFVSEMATINNTYEIDQIKLGTQSDLPGNKACLLAAWANLYLHEGVPLKIVVNAIRQEAGKSISVDNCYLSDQHSVSKQIAGAGLYKNDGKYYQYVYLSKNQQLIYDTKEEFENSEYKYAIGKYTNGEGGTHFVLYNNVTKTVYDPWPGSVEQYDNWKKYKIEIRPVKLAG